LSVCIIPRAARHLQHQLFTLRVAQLDFAQVERIQPLRPLVVGQIGRHHREGFRASHQDRLPERGQLFRAVLVDAQRDAAVLPLTDLFWGNRITPGGADGIYSALSTATARFRLKQFGTW
jgi:hypothetical protein